MANKMTKQQLQQALDNAQEVIRANKNMVSKQPRFEVGGKNPTQLFYQIFNWAKELIYVEPAYKADSRQRDAWLAKVVLKEPFLLGILQSVVSIDKNRGWTLTGGRNQVSRFTDVMHNFQVAPDLYGWRHGVSVTATNYYQSDLGGVVETGRAQKNGVLAAMYTVDPTKCKLTGKIETPLYYQNSARAENKGYWNEYDYFRVTSFPNPNESLNGLGYCAISRCIELAKLMVSVFEHDRERLGSKAPKGILTVNGITQAQWLQSLEESEAEFSELGRAYYAGVQVLAGEAQSPVTVALTSLSSLPEEFSHEQFTNMIIFGYALAFGYDPREFWPVSGGSLGTGRETQEQHRKASSKGGMDYALNHQEKLQEELPDTIQFEYDQRDVEGDVQETAYKKSKLDVITAMFKEANAAGENQITRDEARQLLVEADLIPEEWTEYQEEIEATDTDADNIENEALLDNQNVQRAIKKYPDEDIVRYSYNDNKVRVIYRAGQKRFQIRNVKPVEKKRAAGDYGTIRDKYWREIYDSVDAYLSGTATIKSARNAALKEMDTTFNAAAELGYTEAGGELPFDSDTQSWFDDALGTEFGNIYDLFDRLKANKKDADAIAEAFARADGYAKTLDAIYSQAKMMGGENATLIFVGDDGVNSCLDCQKMQGKKHTIKYILANNLIPRPGNDSYACNGYQCNHYWMNPKTGEEYIP